MTPSVSASNTMRRDTSLKREALNKPKLQFVYTRRGQTANSIYTRRGVLRTPVGKRFGNAHGYKIHINTKRTVGTDVLGGPSTVGLIVFHVFGPSRTPVPTVRLVFM